MNKYYILILLILLTIIYLEFNVKFNLLNKIPISNNDNNNDSNINNYLSLGKLFICTHNYEHKDIFIIFKLFKNFNEKFFMLFADKSWNYILEPFRPNNIEFIYVKENTVNKLSSKILLGKNVIMFLYNHSESSGPYYIVKNTNCKTYLVKIKSKENNHYNKLNKIVNHTNGNFIDIFINNFMKEYIVNIISIKYKLSKYTIKNTFMNQLIYKLYK